ncbi:MAG: hypothetical protein ABI220_02390 [Candidatus Saccharimonadales bacterium]
MPRKQDAPHITFVVCEIDPDEGVAELYFEVSGLNAADRTKLCKTAYNSLTRVQRTKLQQETTLCVRVGTRTGVSEDEVLDDIRKLQMDIEIFLNKSAPVSIPQSRRAFSSHR